MKLTQAIYEATPTSTLVSNVGERYLFADMAPKWYGRHYASFNNVGMTMNERKGEWRLDDSTDINIRNRGGNSNTHRN